MEPDARPIRVLVVDDHAVVRRGLLAFLGSEPDLEVVADVGGGQEALAALERLDAEGRRPDVVLMDMKMEPVDGVEPTRRIRERYDDVAVVVLTSYGEGRHVRSALDAGASGYLLKDADADEVAASLRAAHRGELQLDAAVTRSRSWGRRRREAIRLPRSPRASSRCSASSAPGTRTRRSPASSRSASGRRGRMCRASWRSSASALVLSLRSGPCETASPPDGEAADDSQAVSA